MIDSCGSVHCTVPSCAVPILPVCCRFNGQAGPGAQAVVDIHYRASYELYPDVLLVRTTSLYIVLDWNHS